MKFIYFYSVLTIIACLLLMATPCLAQFALEHDPGYIPLPPPEGASRLIREGDEEWSQFNDNQPDFLFHYNPVDQRIFRFDYGDEASTWRDEAVLVDIRGKILSGRSGRRQESRIIAIWGAGDNQFAVYDGIVDGRLHEVQRLEFPPCAVEQVCLADLDGNGRSEVIASGMTGISTGGGALVWKLDDEFLLQPVMDEDPDFQQMVHSFYGNISLIRESTGRYSLTGITPVGDKYGEYFWTYFYRWDRKGNRLTSQPRETKQGYVRFNKMLDPFIASRARQTIFYMELHAQLDQLKDAAESGINGKVDREFSWDEEQYSLAEFFDEADAISLESVKSTMQSIEYLLGADKDRE